MENFSWKQHVFDASCWGWFPRKYFRTTADSLNGIFSESSLSLSFLSFLIEFSESSSAKTKNTLGGKLRRICKWSSRKWISLTIVPVLPSLAFLQGAILEVCWFLNNKGSLEQGRDVGVEIWCEGGFIIERWKFSHFWHYSFHGRVCCESVSFTKAFKSVKNFKRLIQTFKVTLSLKQISTFCEFVTKAKHTVC